MSYRIALDTAARRDLGSLEREIHTRVSESISLLANLPRPHGSKKLAGQKSRYRIRVGDYRIIYSIDDDSRTIVVIMIRHCKDAYR